MMGKKDCKSQTSKMPAVKESPRYDEKNAPMNPQPYGYLSKTSIMTMRVDTPPKRTNPRWSHPWKKSYRLPMAEERGRITFLHR